MNKVETWTDGLVLDGGIFGEGTNDPSRAFKIDEDHWSFDVRVWLCGKYTHETILSRTYHVSGCLPFSGGILVEEIAKTSSSSVKASALTEVEFRSWLMYHDQYINSPWGLANPVMNWLTEYVTDFFDGNLVQSVSSEDSGRTISLDGCDYAI